jgi:hypothetical protein
MYRGHSGQIIQGNHTMSNFHPLAGVKSRCASCVRRHVTGCLVLDVSAGRGGLDFTGHSITKDVTNTLSWKVWRIPSSDRYRYSNPITGLGRPCVFQQVEDPRFQYNRHMKVVRLSALRTGRHYPQELFLYSFLLGAESAPGSWYDRKDYVNKKIPVTPTEIEPATFRLVAQRLNQLRHHAPLIQWQDATWKQRRSCQEEEEAEEKPNNQ